MSSTICALLGMNVFGELDQVLVRRLGQDTVTEVEDKALLARKAGENVVDLLLDDAEIAEKHDRIEVALNRLAGADLLPSLGERQAPVDSPHLALDRGKLLEKCVGVGAEVDARNSLAVDGRE